MLSWFKNVGCQAFVRHSLENIPVAYEVVIVVGTRFTYVSLAHYDFATDEIFSVLKTVLLSGKDFVKRTPAIRGKVSRQR